MTTTSDLAPTVTAAHRGAGKKLSRTCRVTSHWP